MGGEKTVDGEQLHVCSSCGRWHYRVRCDECCAAPRPREAVTHPVPPVDLTVPATLGQAIDRAAVPPPVTPGGQVAHTERGDAWGNALADAALALAPPGAPLALLEKYRAASDANGDRADEWAALDPHLTWEERRAMVDVRGTAGRSSWCDQVAARMRAIPPAPPPCPKPGHQGVTCAGCAGAAIDRAHDEARELRGDVTTAERAYERAKVDLEQLRKSILGLKLQERDDLAAEVARLRGEVAGAERRWETACDEALAAERERDGAVTVLREVRAILQVNEGGSVTEVARERAEQLENVRAALLQKAEEAATLHTYWREAEAAAERARQSAAAESPLSPADAALLVALIDAERARIGTLACHAGPAGEYVGRLARCRERIVAGEVVT